MSARLSALLLLPLALSGCAVLVPVGAGVLISQQALEDSVYILQVKTDSKQTWTSVKTTLSHLSLKPIETDDAAHKAIADIDGAKVTVGVDAYDLDQSTIKVAATKYGMANGATASMVKDRILSDLEHKN